VSLRHAVHRAEEGLLALILGVMTALTFAQVILRYGFNAGFIWQLEANFYLFSWLVMLGISYCVRESAHSGVSALVRLLPPRPRRAVGILVLLLALLYAVLMFYGAVEYLGGVIASNVEAEDIPIKAWILCLCLPLGFALLLYRLLEVGWHMITGRARGYELTNEADEALKDFAADRGPDATTGRR
jgi:C4-dicarboxylate transporter DctQ subunit